MFRLFEKKNNNDDCNTTASTPPSTFSTITTHTYSPNNFSIFPKSFSQLLNQTLLGVCVGMTLVPLGHGEVIYHNKKYNLRTLTTHLGLRYRDLYKFNTIRRCCVIVPIIEEAIFRGLIMPVMYAGVMRATEENKKIAEANSIIGSSLLFSALHPKNVRIFSFILGMSCATITMLTNSLWASTAAHMTNNSIALISYRRRILK